MSTEYLQEIRRNHYGHNVLNGQDGAVLCAGIVSILIHSRSTEHCEHGAPSWNEILCIVRAGGGCTLEQ